MIFIILTILIIITLLVCITYSFNNKLNFYNIRIKKAEEEIEKELDNRYSIVKEIQKTIEKSTKMELKIYKDLDDLRDKKTISTNPVIYLLACYPKHKPFCFVKPSQVLAFLKIK